MPEDPSRRSKRQALQETGVLNPRPEEVTDPLFEGSEFFDPLDLVQVKYEMLRRVDRERQTVTEAATRFGFSRVTFYQARGAFESDGLAGLVPKRRGPRGGHKLTADVLEFLDAVRAQEPSLAGAELAVRLQERFGLTVHPRSIEKALVRREKKRR
jgi:transposase